MIHELAPIKWGLERNNQKQFWIRGEFFEVAEINDDRDIIVNAGGCSSEIFKGQGKDLPSSFEDILAYAKAAVYAGDFQKATALSHLWESIGYLQGIGPEWNLPDEEWKIIKKLVDNWYWS